MTRSRLILTAVAAVLTVLPSLAVAQEAPKPLTWVGFMNVKPGADMMFEKAFEKYQVPLLNKLVADGHAMSWGLGYELAGPGGYDYVMWVTMPGWAGMSAVEGAFDDRWETMSEDELKGMIEEWMGAIEPDDQVTQLLRHAVFNAAPDTDYNYLRLSAYTVKPGHGKDVMKMYSSLAKPVYQELMEGGKIAGYGMIEQVIDADDSFTHETWITFKDLADLDTIEKAFMAAGEDVSEADQTARQLAFLKMVEPGAHHDRLIRVWKHSD